MTKRLLVVDWDYFFPVDEHGKHWGLYDWGHQEGRDIFLNRIWPIRAAGFKQYNLPLPMTSGEEKAFWKRFRFSKDAQLFIADSNSRAAKLEVAEDVSSVYLFDAHHDSGYRDGALDRVLKEQRVSCEDWMIGYYLEGAKKLDVRYPRWRHYAMQYEPKPAIPVHRQVDDGQAVPLTFHRVFICRSGAWTPPWLDERFEAFVLSCPAPLVARLDDIEKRQWSEEAVDEHVKAWNELKEKVK